MPTTFFGKWSLEVTGNVGEFDQRARIQGSLNADGNLSAPVGADPQIDGAAWLVFLERSSDGGVTWQENLVKRIPTVTPQNGLTVTLFGDDSDVPPQDSDVTVTFVYLDPNVNPKPVPPIQLHAAAGLVQNTASAAPLRMLLQSPVLFFAADTRQETTTTLLLNAPGRLLSISVKT